ncbi:MAG: hypothetical protein F6K09_33075 [Merismopedia sp. SIO2A8]|nr:hypothetical protein [Symploca sp. SIO2B6]NET53319.1 hypothetical protein [Merismopedia sp. SIO2A8]
MTYKDKLFPWRIIRHLPNMQRLVVARFRRRNEAEAYLKTLQGLMPNLKHIIIFDIEPEDINQALQENTPPIDY